MAKRRSRIATEPELQHTEVFVLQNEGDGVVNGRDGPIKMSALRRPRYAARFARVICMASLAAIAMRGGCNMAAGKHPLLLKPLS